MLAPIRKLRQGSLGLWIGGRCQVLYIETTGEPSTSRGWHVGEPEPKVKGPVVTIQADGEELQVILRAIREVSGKPRLTIEVPGMIRK